MARSTGCILNPNTITLYENDKLIFLTMKPAVDVDLATMKISYTIGHARR